MVEKFKEHIMQILLVITAVLITVTGIVFKQSFIRILPLYVSLFVSLLQSKVSRIAYLLGGINSILYALVYFSFKLYASALYAVLFSCIFQLVTYFMWKKRPAGKATVFRAMSVKVRILGVLGFAALWIVMWYILSASDSGYRFFDITGSLLGGITTILTMMAFIEYVPIIILSLCINIGLYISMMAEEPAQITYLIYALFALLCQFRALGKVIILYKQQNRKFEEN